MSTRKGYMKGVAHNDRLTVNYHRLQKLLASFSYLFLVVQQWPAVFIESALNKS